MEINNGTSDIGYNGTEIRPEPIYGNTDFVDTWFLMGSPISVAIILTSYLLFVLKIGPAFMMKRAPYQLSNVLLLYNAVQVGVSCFLFHKCFAMLVENGVVPKTCLMETDYSRRSITTAMYCYLLAKVSELLDTIFFILRKKNNQVTFLHVYHHAVMVFVTWTALKYEPTFALVFMGMLNSFVHIVMYTYYGLSAYPNLVKYLWWKKYITKLQLLQFVLVLLQFGTAFATSSCPPSKIMFASMIFNGLLFIYLFGSFYINTYNRRNKKVNNAKESNRTNGLKEEFNGIQKENGQDRMKICKDEKVTDGNGYTSAAIKLNDKYRFTFNLQTKKLL
ncbi:elongation of very long chain fatty acids protein 7-like [Spodoptera frugiperda]|uniref:Elongation of very long chain fatty acids protein n=1 Tax=Spodoptera frugiperda TaxID=7108 RepID=A0A9R0E259_SPOFR|nr:elongation of very long chain fatty acids protein 7-like [Spodoptera frugiperda]